MSCELYRPNVSGEKETLLDPLASMDLWQMCGLRNAWVQIHATYRRVGQVPTEAVIRETLTHKGVSHEYHGLRPGAPVQYQLPDGSFVRGALAADEQWLTHSYLQFPDERFAYERAMLRPDNEVMTFAVEVGLRHALIRRPDPETMRISVDARDIGLLTEKPGTPSRLQLLVNTDVPNK